MKTRRHKKGLRSNNDKQDSVSSRKFARKSRLKPEGLFSFHLQIHRLFIALGFAFNRSELFSHPHKWSGVVLFCTFFFKLHFFVQRMQCKNEHVGNETSSINYEVQKDFVAWKINIFIVNNFYSVCFLSWGKNCL